MDTTVQIIISIFLTAIFYMAFPIICLLCHGKKFDEKKAKKISLWNSIAVGIFFCILTSINGGVWRTGAACLYYGINYALLADRSSVKMKKKIIKSSNNNLHVYSTYLTSSFNNGGNHDDARIHNAKKVYLDAICNDVLHSYFGNSSAVHQQIKHLLDNPTICGYPIPAHSTKYGTSGGALFAALYYARNNKKADGRICVAIDNHQRLILKEYHKILFPSIDFSLIDTTPTITVDVSGSDFELKPSHVASIANDSSSINEKIAVRKKAYAEIEQFYDYWQRGIITEEEFRKSRDMILQVIDRA